MMSMIIANSFIFLALISCFEINTATADKGATYIRWGRTVCPTDRTGATLVYEGVAAGSKWSESGGGANYLCLPKTPEYWPIGTGTSSYQAFLYGAEYHSRHYPSFIDSTAPCAMCLAVNKSATIMIPAKITCPKSWTREYNGYLVAEHYTHANNVVFECVDFNREKVPGTSNPDPEASFHHVRSTCYGLSCPPFVQAKDMACVVCSK
ncbi:PREDICTED: short-chain collagen C4-like [Amphimedon queenslandica]|uniref:Chitin-binding type-4 domain-containing protein n=1 Tax=Amphimedon queenslandica TaxID=400682 RepID=A0A1X7UDI4_AMPQE|nr:PREDICTED: short-chain collagen C4-like [Amphimedon queenslandica]|eukprot:XP_003388338.2 PREDICTED: short-chain collagen C4-like [Amphimedon queenslandica]